MQNEDTWFRVKEISKYDYVPYAPEEKRKALLDRSIHSSNRNLVVKGGTAALNPYKRIYDLRMAEGLAKMEMLNESKLWSPRFTPSFFGKVYLPIVGSGILFCLYIHYVSIPKNMLRRRRLYGTRFPDLERKGFLDNWMVEDFHDDIYSDEILKEMELLTHSTPVEPDIDHSKIHNAKLAHDTMLLTNRARMTNQLTDLYTKRKQVT